MPFLTSSSPRYLVRSDFAIWVRVSRHSIPVSTESHVGSHEREPDGPGIAKDGGAHDE